MLFRLQMSIDQAISAYADLASYVFSEKKWPHQEGTFKASRLEEAIAKIIGEALRIEKREAIETRMINKEFPNGAKGWVDYSFH